MESVKLSGQITATRSTAEIMDEIAVRIGNAFAVEIRHRLGCLDCWAKTGGAYRFTYPGSGGRCEVSKQLERDADRTYEEQAKVAWELVSEEVDQFVRARHLEALSKKTSAYGLERLASLSPEEISAAIAPKPKVEPPAPTPAPPVDAAAQEVSF